MLRSKGGKGTFLMYWSHYVLWAGSAPEQRKARVATRVTADCPAANLQRHVTVNSLCVAGRYDALSRVVWCRRHATSSETRAGCPMLGATASAVSPGDPTPVPL